MAERLARGRADRGVVIGSGMARRIDSRAHQGALSSATGTTIAVLGCWIDRVHPEGEQKVFEVIQERGAIISEFPIWTFPAPHNFPIGNRVAAGIALGVVVVEGAQYSGSLITGRLDDGVRPRGLRRARQRYATFQLRTESADQAGRQACDRVTWWKSYEPRYGQNWCRWRR